jgi:putative ABC transport system permease protein
MLRNYFVIALRSLQKNGVYSFINIAGLSIGLTCTILILLWVSNELSWNGFHEKKKNLYRVYLNGKGDDAIYTQMAICLPLWEEFKNNERDIVHVTPTNWGQTHLLSYGDQHLYKTGYYASEDFLKMFTFPLVKGPAENQLKDPSTIVITEGTAKALFGNDEPLGKVIRVDDRVDLTVSGVVKDVPSNSSFDFQCLIPFSTYMNRESWVKDALTRWDNNSFNLYVEFRDGADPAAIESRVKDVIKKHSKENESEVTFLAMDRWRLYSEFKNGKSVSGLIVYVRMFMVIAAFILVIACINFMNLATARSEKRAKEVGIRKSIGSRRKELIMQFMGETLIISFIAFVIAIGMVEITLPFYNVLVNKSLFIDYSNPVLWLIACGFILFTGFIAGSYPAFYLSSFNPATVLKGKLQAGRKGTIPRKVMVTAQFFFSILLIISTIIIYSQLNYLKNRPTGYDRENLLSIEMTGDIGKNYKAIKTELLSKGLASAVCKSSSPITSIYAFLDADWQGKREEQRKSFATVATEYDYTKTMGIRMVQGRDFSEDFNDSLSVILNQAAVDYIGFKNPIGEKIIWNGGVKYTIVGVMQNVVMLSPHQPVDPMILVYDPGWINDMSIRLPKNVSAHSVMSEIENVYKKYNPNYPFSYAFADQEFNKKFTSIQLIGRLANVFAVLAIFISCLGLFGLAAFTAEQRTKEIGIRKVLGANISNLVMLLSKDFTALVILAFLLAAPLSWWAMDNWLSQYSYRISIEWWILATAGILALGLSLLTVSYQAIRAAIANPVRALRNE